MKAVAILVDSGSDRELHREAVEVTPSIDVEPRPLRRARLKWEAVPNAKEYRVVFHESSTTSRSITVTDDTYLDISLDSIFASEKGLANSPYQYDFEVRAQDSGNSYRDSEYSDTITIIDNPLLTEGGRAYASNGGDEASLEWTTVTNASNYEIRYRKLGHYTVLGEGTKNHTSLDWPKEASWPYYHGAETEPSDTPGNDTIDDLDEGDIYTFQINYEIGDTKVFSARDAYVWPSDVKPAERARVGTYPFFGHHTGGTFNYTICENMFPDPDTTTMDNEWVELIKSAFGQWEVATQVGTDKLITMTPTVENCPTGTTGSPTAKFIQDDDQRNEVRMLDIYSPSIYSLWEFKSDVFKICLTEGPACVTSFSGYSGLQTNCDVSTNTCQIRYGPLGIFSIDRTRIAKLLEDYQSTGIPSPELLGVIDTAARNDRQASNELQGVDITFKESDFPVSSVTMPTSIKFNTCLPDKDAASDDSDQGYFAYTTAVHEAGHALGLSNFSYVDLVIPWSAPQEYHTAHPTIPDAVMNYDNAQRIRHPVGASFSEPDCSPHPFDIMAIYALYQTVP